MDKRFEEMIGKDIISIGEQWEQLSTDDLIELKELGATKVHCVYDDWADLAKTLINKEKSRYLDIQYMFDCIDVDKLAKYILKNNIMYTELDSGKVVDYD